MSIENDNRPRGWLRLGVAATLAVAFAYGLLSAPQLAGRWGLSPIGFVLVGGWLALAGLAWPLIRHRPHRLTVVGLAVVATGLRIVMGVACAGRTPGGDALLYPRIAASVLHGTGLRVYEPFIGSTLYALYPPAYPLLLAGWGAIAGLSVPSLIALNTLLDGVSAWLVYRLAIRLGHDGAGRGAAWLYLVWPSMVLSAPFAQKEALCTALVLALAVTWLAAVDRPERRLHNAVAIGLPAALLALGQPGQAPLAALFGLALADRASIRTIVTTGIAAAAVAALVMLPWWIRNAIIFGAFVPLTSAGQVSLWVGNNPDATGNWVPTPTSLRGLPELDFARAAGAMARDWILANPAAFVRLTITKFLRATGLAQADLVRLEGLRPGLAPRLLAILLPLVQAAHLAMLGCAAAALFVRRSAIPAALVRVIAACGIQMILFGVWFEFGERHRDFATPFLLLAVTVALRSATAIRSAPATSPLGR